MSGDRKVALGSSGWLAAAKELLEELVAAHGEPGQSFSVCEVFTNAPENVAISGTVAWHFRIRGNSVEVGTGVIEDVDMNVRADYFEALPTARLVYTPEILAERAEKERLNGASPRVQGSRASAPAYLIELHNRLAVITE